MAVISIYTQAVDIINQMCLDVNLNCSSTPLCVGSIGDLDGGEDNLPDDVSLSGEEAGASDQDDSAECDESSPSFAPLYNEGKKKKKAIIKSNAFALTASDILK